MPWQSTVVNDPNDAAPPIACSLSPGELVERGDDWSALLSRALVSADRIASGVRLTVRPAAAAELARLVDLERGCCPWMSFDFERPETVAVTASGEGVEVLALMFLGRTPS
jgi:hypothetical protein